MFHAMRCDAECPVPCVLCSFRLLGHSSEMNSAGALTVSVDGREVAITCIHVGVDLPRVQQALDSRYSTYSLFSLSLLSAQLMQLLPPSLHPAVAWREEPVSLFSLFMHNSHLLTRYWRYWCFLFQMICSTFEAEVRVWRDPFPGKTIVAGKTRRHTISCNMLHVANRLGIIEFTMMQLFLSQVQANFATGVC